MTNHKQFLICALTLALVPTTGASQTVSEIAARRARIVEVIKDHPNIRVQTTSMYRGHIMLGSPEVTGNDLTGSVQAGTFRGQPTFEHRAIAINEIDEIKVQNGTKALLGLGIGVGTGLVFAMIMHQYCINDPLCEGPSTGYPAIYAMSVGGFGLLMTIVGATQKRWETIYSRGTPIIIEGFAARGRYRTYKLGLALSFR